MTVASHVSQLQETKKNIRKRITRRKKATCSRKRRRRRKSSIYRQTITNQYFLRSISDCARRWPHPKRRPKQQQDIEGDSDMYIYIHNKRRRERERQQRYLLEGLDEEKRAMILPPTSFLLFFCREKRSELQVYIDS